MIKFPEECPVCRAKYISLVKRINTESAGLVELFYCMECESFSSPFAPDHLNGPTLNHHLSVFDRNLDFTTEWLANIQHNCKPVKILDIGCGIGSLLYSARGHGIEGIGFDVDIEAARYGASKYGLDLRGEMWSSNCDLSDAGLEGGIITCIMVLEHIKWPRPLIRELILGGRKWNCQIYISVPWFNRTWWHHLLAPNEQNSPLAVPWVHVTHFSDKGFLAVCKEMGVKSVEKISSEPWAGFLITP